MSNSGTSVKTKVASFKLSVDKPENNSSGAMYEDFADAPTCRLTIIHVRNNGLVHGVPNYQSEDRQFNPTIGQAK